jgi:hypothetical protein
MIEVKINKPVEKVKEKEYPFLAEFKDTNYPDGSNDYVVLFEGRRMCFVLKAPFSVANGLPYTSIKFDAESHWWKPLPIGTEVTFKQI